MQLEVTPSAETQGRRGLGEQREKGLEHPTPGKEQGVKISRRLAEIH